MKRHLLIPDTQVKPGMGSTKHLKALANFIKEHQPEVIVMIGDWWDMESLSVYDMGKAAAELKRYQQDIDVGNREMDRLVDAIDSVRGYKPKCIFTLGNHEQRIARTANEYPWLEDKMSYNDLSLDRWDVYDFLEIATVDGIAYSHYFINKGTGRPIGGRVDNKLNKLGFSFTHGHQQEIGFAHRCLNNGNTIQGLVAGAFYQHKERYLGPQGNHHWRGICMKHDVKNGAYDLEIVGMERLLKEYK